MNFYWKDKKDQVSHVCTLAFEPRDNNSTSLAALRPPWNYTGFGR